MNTKDLRGRIALITGGAGGLAGAIARALAAEGVDLVLSDLPSAPVDDRLQQLRGLGVRAAAVAADLADSGQASALATAARDALGPIDILVNNAGVEFTGQFTTRSPQSLEDEVQINLLAPLLLTRAVLPEMLERRQGNVVNVASVAGKLALPYFAGYVATKSGLAAFTRSLAAEYGNGPVAFSTVFPGLIRGQGMGAAFSRSERMTRTPEEVGAAVVEAIREDRLEIVVSAQPTRVPSVLSALAPPLGVRSMRRLRPQLNRLLERGERA